ncbi:MAG: hypothetical protein IJP17_03335 [Clostridia bacterium]|nr:hypothetical protein [Clostridia bacterium]
MKDVIMIGCFAEFYKKGNYPSIKDCIHTESPENKEKVLRYLKKGRVVAVAPGFLHDVISGKSINMELTTITDGEYTWRSDLIYYYEHYNVDLSDDFIKKAISQKV